VLSIGEFARHGRVLAKWETQLAFKLAD